MRQLVKYVVLDESHKLHAMQRENQAINTGMAIGRAIFGGK